MLQHGRPAVGDGAVQVSVDHVIKFDLFVLFFRAVDHAAHVGIDEGALAGFGHLGPLQLAVLPAMPVHVTAIAHLVLQVDGITAAMKHVALDDLDAFRAAPGHGDYQFIGRIGHAVAALFRGIDDMVCRLGTDTGAQARLDDKQIRQAVIQEAKRRGTRLGGRRVGQQVGLAQIATGGIDPDLEEVGFNLYIRGGL